MVRIASFNVENLFARPNAFRSTDLSVAEPVLDAYGEVNALIKQSVYSDADKTRIRNLLVTLDIYTVNTQGAIRRKTRTATAWRRRRSPPPPDCDLKWFTSTWIRVPPALVVAVDQHHVTVAASRAVRR